MTFLENFKAGKEWKLLQATAKSNPLQKQEALCITFDRITTAELRQVTRFAKAQFPKLIVNGYTRKSGQRELCIGCR